MNIKTRLIYILSLAFLVGGMNLAAAGELQQYVIERDIPGAGQLSAEELRDISTKSNAVLANLGDDIRWIQSYITGDTVYCVYEATDPDLIRLHAEQGGFPADRVSPVSAVIDPSTGQ